MLLFELDSVLIAQTNFWEPAGLENYSINCLAVNSSDQIFAGVPNQGVFRSTNNGISWDNINAGLTSEVVCFGINLCDVVFAGTRSGVFQLNDTDNGWIPIGSGFLMPKPMVHILEVSPYNRHIFASVYNDTDSTGEGIYRSVDDGNTWIRLTDQNIIGNIAFNVTGDIFAGQDATGLYRSTDNGNGWTHLPSAPGPMSLVINSNGHIFLGNYDSHKVHRSTDNGDSWIDLLDSPNAYSLAINSVGHIFAGARGGPSGRGIYCSIDNGNNWENTGLTQVPCGPVRVAFNSFGYVYVGTCIGVFRSVQSTTSVNEISKVFPSSFELYQNYPNPFNPSTTISWQSPLSSWQTLKVYDVLGNEVAILVDEYKPAGSYEVEFNASKLSSGIYFYKLQAGEFSDTKKLLLVK